MRVAVAVGLRVAVIPTLARCLDGRVAESAPNVALSAYAQGWAVTGEAHGEQHAHRDPSRARAINIGLGRSETVAAKTVLRCARGCQG